MRLTDEQDKILKTNENIVINAVAGSGKTTTLIQYAATRLSHKRILYLAFNRSVKIEAEQKFKAAGLTNVTVETAHSLAFNYIVKSSAYSITTGYKTYDWVELLDITTGDRHVDFMISNHVSKFISYFCNSTVTKVQQLNYRHLVTDEKASQFVDNFYSAIEQYTRLALAKMDKGAIAITHDFYLKKFQLSEPRLPYDYILFDEGQDASGAMLDVFLKQTAIKIIVGDVHQQIYGWRFAINSLLLTEFPFYNLSSSFRFNEEIASIANKVLSWKKQLNQPPSIVVKGARKSVRKSTTKATLARTNVNLLLSAIDQWQNKKIKKVFFEGKMSSYTFADEGASLYDVLNLYNGQPDRIRDKLIAGMQTMKELEDYIEKTEDNSLSTIVEVVKEFGNELPHLINQLKQNEVATREEADMIFGTVHRCKGMEYDEVTLLSDFITEEKLKRYIAEQGGEKISEVDKNRLIEEVNILYVAVTRAKYQLFIPEYIHALEKLKKANPKGRYTVNKTSVKTYASEANQGKSWSRAEDDQLTGLFHAGVTISEMAAQMERTHGGIRKRLVRLGLASDYSDLYDDN